MFPLLWIWSPHMHWPWSGNVKQNIEPNTHWFFAGIAPNSGHANIEERAFELASYGTQLGLLTQLVLDLCKQLPPSSPEVQKTMERIEWIRMGIERIKTEAYKTEGGGQQPIG
jgi:hypothetical protein